MTFAAPLFAWLAGAVALATVALHLLAWRRPPESPLPTARFAPERPIRMVSRAVRPADLALLALRVALVLLVGAALAGPIVSPRRGGVARVIVLDRSRSAGTGVEAANVARRVFRPGDALVVFDSVPREVVAPAPDSITPAVSDATGSLSPALVVATRIARRLAYDHDSVTITIVSPFAADELDAATGSIRRTWAGAVQVLRAGTLPNETLEAGRPEIRAPSGDAVAVALALAGPFNGGRRVRVARDALTGTDSAWGRAGNAIVVWPAMVPGGWQRTARIDTAFAVTALAADPARGATVVARFERMTIPPAGRVIARWSDGEPAATESALGSGCIRSIGVPVPATGDLALTPAFRRFALRMAGPCGDRPRSAMASDSLVAAVLPATLREGEVVAGASVGRDRPHSMLSAWLLGLALAAAAAEMFLRRGERMQPLERVHRTRRALAATIAVRALLWSVCAVLAIGAVATVLAHLRGHVVPVATWVGAGTIAVAVLAALIMPWRRLTVLRVALWIEERVPRLQYALVTTVDPAAKTGPVAALLEDAVRGVSWQVETRRAISRSLTRPFVAVVVAVLALLGARRVDVAAASAADRSVSATTATSRNAASPFARLVATVRTPAYAGGRVVRVESPASLSSLVGSVVTLEAPGPGEGVAADTSAHAIPVQRTGDVWRVSIAMGPRPALVRLRHGSGDRVVALEPRLDSVPVVRLLVPPRDTVMRVARGAMRLAAEAHDDLGLLSGAFEYIVSSGEGESFKFRSGTLGARQLGGAASGALVAALALDGLDLEPGDMVHLRAVARDGNTVSGPGVGASETRVLRVARAGEYDTVAVEGAPPPEADKSLISQRMLIMLTEALERRRPRLARETLLSESRAIGRDQTRLRKRVGDIIFARLGDDPTGEHGHGPDEEPAEDTVPPRVDSAARDSARQAALRAGRSARQIAAADSADSARAALLRAASAATGSGREILDFEGDETPIVAINRPLLEAYNAMWEASRELDQGETARALPPMRRALAAIQRARQAERIYLRGKAPAVVVDLARVRLTGKETGAPSTRSPRPPADPAAALRAERLASAIVLASSVPAAAIDSLVLLRVEALEAAPSLAAAIADALDAMRNGRDATALLARARRIADGGLRGSSPLRAWSGAW